MANFNVGSLNDWQPLSVSQPVDFDIPTAGFRAISFDLFASDQVTVEALSSSGQTWLLAVGSGLLSVKFTTAEPVSVVVQGPEDTILQIRSFARDQMVIGSGDPTFTRIEPRGSSRDDEFRRIMHMVELKQRQRDDSMRQEVFALRNELRRAQQAAVTAPTGTPASSAVSSSAPAPIPASSPEGGE